MVGGRYGLGSKDFTPAMVKAVFDNLSPAAPKNHFTVGIDDDVTGTSLPVDESFRLGDKAFRALFYGLGADGTVGANKNTIKIIGGETDNFAQGYFAYDAKKSGSMTESHLRFGKDAIRNPYLLSDANFVACHNESFLEKYDMLAQAEEGAIFLLTTLPRQGRSLGLPARRGPEAAYRQEDAFFIIDAISLAEEIGLGARINMIMQTAFFVISGIIPKDEAIKAIKKEITKTYGKKGEEVLQMNYAAVDTALQNIDRGAGAREGYVEYEMRPPVPDFAPPFVKERDGR